MIPVGDERKAFSEIKIFWGEFSKISKQVYEYATLDVVSSIAFAALNYVSSTLGSCAFFLWSKITHLLHTRTINFLQKENAALKEVVKDLEATKRSNATLVQENVRLVQENQTLAERGEDVAAARDELRIERDDLIKEVQKMSSQILLLQQKKEIAEGLASQYLQENEKAIKQIGCLQYQLSQESGASLLNEKLTQASAAYQELIDPQNNSMPLFTEQEIKELLPVFKEQKRKHLRYLQEISATIPKFDARKVEIDGLIHICGEEMKHMEAISKTIHLYMRVKYLSFSAEEWNHIPPAQWTNLHNLNPIESTVTNGETR